MAGEYQLAQTAIDQAMQEAEDNPAMSSETLANAMIGHILSKQAKTRSKVDLLSFVEHHLDNLSDDEFVITRGC